MSEEASVMLKFSVGAAAVVVCGTKKNKKSDLKFVIDFIAHRMCNFLMRAVWLFGKSG